MANEQRKQLTEDFIRAVFFHSDEEGDFADGSSSDCEDGENLPVNHVAIANPEPGAMRQG